VSVGVGYEASGGRDTSGIGNSWGTRGGSFIRSIFNAVIPVTIVERWYGELDGSLSGITVGTPGALGFRPSCELFSDSADWELHALNIVYPTMATVGLTAGANWYRIQAHIYTALLGFDPIEFNPTIVFGPVLITNASVNQGTVRGQAGVAPTNNPLGLGWLVTDTVTRVGANGTATTAQTSDSSGLHYVTAAQPLVVKPLGSDKKLMNSIKFPRPLRIKRGRRLTISLHGIDDTFSYQPLHSLVVSALYSELPNPRRSYSTP